MHVKKNVWWLSIIYIICPNNRSLYQIACPWIAMCLQFTRHVYYKRWTRLLITIRSDSLVAMIRFIELRYLQISSVMGVIVVSILITGVVYLCNDLNLTTCTIYDSKITCLAISGMALFSISSGCTPRASLIGVESSGQLESVRSRAVYKQKTPVVVSESSRSQAPAARFSAFRLPTSRGECTRRATAPAPLTHHARSRCRSPHTRYAVRSSLGQPFDFDHLYRSHFSLSHTLLQLLHVSGWPIFHFVSYVYHSVDKFEPNKHFFYDPEYALSRYFAYT